MNRIHFAVLIAALALAPAALTACGGGGDNSADQDDITAAITKAATSGDPAACTEVQTQKFTDQTSGSNGTGAAAVKSCEKDAADSVSDSVDVANIEVDGDTATAEATFGGGLIDGQTLDLSLVKDGDQWKLDSVDDFANFDRAAFTTSVLGTITKQSGGQGSDCLKQQFDKATDEQLQSIILDPNGGDELFKPCFGE